MVAYWFIGKFRAFYANNGVSGKSVLGFVLKCQAEQSPQVNVLFVFICFTLLHVPSITALQ